jgi:hypothetical protein
MASKREAEVLKVAAVVQGIPARDLPRRERDLHEPERVRPLELLDIPRRWGRVDAFGRGRVDAKRGTRR